MATVDIKINNKTYNGVSVVNLPLSDGSGYAPFNLDTSHIVVKNSITYNLTNVTSSNTATTIPSGSAFTTVLSTQTGYIVGGVTVTMDGTDITASAYTSTTKEVSISSVTGDIVITATAEVDLTAPAYEISTPVIMGNTEDTRINDTTNNYIYTGETVNDNEDWTVCLDFTSASGVKGGGIASNGSQVSILGYSMPNWTTNWHAQGGTIMNDYSGGNLAGNKHILVVLTHQANALSAEQYGTVERTLSVSSIATAASGQVKIIVGTTAKGTLNRFAIYKRVLDSDEITSWLGA